MKNKTLFSSAAATLLYLILVTPVFAHEDPGLSSVYTLAPILGGLIGGVALAAAGAQMIKPRPHMASLAVLFGLGFAGVLHLAVALLWGDNLLLLNGSGFVVLGVAWGWFSGMIPGGQKSLAAVIGVYTLITFVGYFVTHDHLDTVGVISKIGEALLLISLGWAIFKPSAG